MKIIRIFIIILLSVLLISCGNTSSVAKEVKEGNFHVHIGAGGKVYDNVCKIVMYDGTTELYTTFGEILIFRDRNDINVIVEKGNCPHCNKAIG